jgi:serine/threonine-protein kinase
MALTRAGRYELIEEVGRGAMGVVFKAFDPMIGRTVAVKTMRLLEGGAGMNRQEMLQRFQTEARAAGQLVHPNIIVIHDAGEDQGLYFITMEFVDGKSLQGLVDSKQPFPLPRIMRIMGQVCSALEYAHQRSVVHRDIKPANIVLTHDDTVKVTDFGTAKILAMSTTQSGSIVGTPSYMAPEQVRGKPVDGRSDIFSLGVVLYELVTGEKPFPGENVTTVIYKIVNEEPIPPREIDSSVHPGLSDVILKSLAKDPERRYQSCREMMQDLLNYRSIGVPGAPAGYDATVVVVGQRRPAGPAPPPAFEPPASRTGTLSGLPVSGDIKPPGATPEAPPAAASGKRSFAAPSVLFPQAPPPAESSPRAASSLPRPMTLPPLPRDEDVQGVVGAPEGAEKKKGARWVLVLILLAVIGGGGYVLWNNLKEVFLPPQQTQSPQKPEEPAGAPQGPAAGGTAAVPEPETAKPESKAPPPASKQPAKAETPAASAAKAPAKEKPPEAASARADAAAVAARVRQALARDGLGRKVDVEVSEGLIRLSGTLTAREARLLRQRFRTPAGYSVEYAISEPVASEEDPARARPKTAPGMGEVEVLTDVTGARAHLTGPGGKYESECRTPCRFEDLWPGRYSLQITREGYRTERRILNVRAGNISEVQVSLTAAVARLQLQSRPAGAEIYVDGARQPQKTPATIAVSPGERTIRLQLEGFAPYETQISLEENDLKTLSAQLPARPAARGPGWIEVRTVPRGADILIDNTNTGRKTPDKLELPAGEYTLTLYLKGYVAVREKIVVTPNQTLQLNKALTPQ